ncbi:hypothetical protein, partial [Faecalimonas sp.]
MNDKKWFKKPGLYVLIVILILTIIGIPVVINEIYKYGATISKPYITIWGADEVLSYYGTVLSFLGTFILGVVAYKQNERGNRTNDKLAELTKQANNLTEQANTLNKELNERNIKANIRPALVINRVRAGYIGDWPGAVVAWMQRDIEDISPDAIKNVDDIKYYEEEIEGFYFTIEKKFLKFSHKLRKEQLENIEKKIHPEKIDNEYTMVSENNLYAPYRLLSVGTGPAVNVSVRLYKQGEKGNRNVDVASVPLSLKTNVDYILGFYLENIIGMDEKYIFPAGVKFLKEDR